MTSENAQTGELNELQISLLRLFGQGLDQQQTLDVRRLLVHYFSAQLNEEVSRVVEEKGYTDDDFRRMLVDDSFPMIQKPD